MTNFDNWLGSSTQRGTPTATLAAGAWNRIQDKPTSITVYRGATPQAAQTVRLEFDLTVTENQSDMAQASVWELVIFGVVDHPDDAVTDTDLQNGDRFVHDGDTYEIMDVVAYPGEIQARAERRT